MLLKGGTLVRLHPPALVRADLRIEGDTIVARGARLAAKREEPVEDCRGRLILPGFVCAHTHMYSALSRGMPGPAPAPASFPEMLRRVWWRLDDALTEEAVYYSAMIGAVEALRAGTTTLIDHHASPNAIAGSLDIIREAFAVVGVRGVLCYEVTDRGGLRRRDAGLAENDRFLSATRTDSQFRGLVGAHASFTLGERSLAALGDLARYHRSGIHIHVAEARDDGARTRRLHLVDPRRVVERGYAIVRLASGRVVIDAGQAPRGARVTAELKSGRLGLVSEGPAGEGRNEP